MEDEEMNSISGSQLLPEQNDAATNKSAYQTEAALCSPIEVHVKKSEDFSLSKGEENSVEYVMFGSEEDKTEENVLQDNMDLYNDNIAKASKSSSLRIILNKKEINSISGSQLSPDDCGAVNASQSELVIVTHEDEEENVMPVFENVEFGSEREITQGSEIEKEKVVEEIEINEQNVDEAKSLGEEEKPRDNDDQKTNEQDGSSTKKVLKKVEKTGMIFMCSKKTKRDCFDYKVFGQPASKIDVVRKVFKGMMLFLFDIDLRVMYGIYEAAAPGAYNIEPNAFESLFPSQVRFSIVKDCMPLSEEKFRMAIKDNYYRKNMFNFELTSKQVKNLCKLFVAENNGPCLSVENNDLALSFRANELSSIPIDMDIEETDEVNALFSNNRKMHIKEKEKVVVEANEEDEKSASQEEEGENEGDPGMIFMCSSKTKQDCLLYKVLGLPANKREIVQKVEKGMKLFMFDVDLRLMYGIYKATGPGGYNIEPKAFNSSFPSQVQFTVLKDCPPLTEEKFRTAIKDNYYRKNKFKFQLTSNQVTKLSQLFVAGSQTLKQDDEDNTSQSKELEGNCVEVTQSNQTEESTNEVNAIVGNYINTTIEEGNEGTAIEKEEKDENHFADDDKEESVCRERQEEGVREGETKDLAKELVKNKEEVGVNTKEKTRKKRKRRGEKKHKDGNLGMIFMCSSRTKPDCLYYKILGLPANKREVVEKIHKGMRLFMFDVELRLMYGIYEAAGPGGYNLEPYAFNSGFPSQVRFTVVDDCLPLEEEKFKVAIKDNYYTKWKFDCELTSEQVNDLCRLFSSGNKRRDGISQQRVMPFAQFPVPAHPPMYSSYENANVHTHVPPTQLQVPLFEPSAQNSGWSTFGPTQPY